MNLQLESNDTISNSTFVGWVPGPDTRGTLSILVSSIGTLLICVWSSMHLNLPQKNEGSRALILRYLKWCFLSLLGPELVIWTAWRQFISARSLLQESQRCYAPYTYQGSDQSNSSSSLSSSSATSTWTMSHGFYAGMGGFVVDLDSKDALSWSESVHKLQRLTITPKGIDLLAKCGHLPSISSEEIEDKSKSDSLGKTLAILQGAWMLVQVITRLCLNLPVTLLEVMTLAHVLCAVVIYGMWWYKPRWVNQPTKIDYSELKPLIAFMYMCSHVSADEEYKTGILRDLGAQSEMACLTLHPDNQFRALKEDQARAGTRSSPNITSGSFRIRSPTFDESYKNSSDLEQGASALSDMSEKATNERRRLALEAIAQYPAVTALFKQPRKRSNTKFEAALRNYPEMPKRFQSRINAISGPCQTGALYFRGEQYVSLHADDWPNEDLYRRTEGLLMGCVLWFASIGFSAVHIAAWDADFPTFAEKWLWRSSSLFIAGSGLLWLCIHILADISETVWWYWYDVLAFDVRWYHYAILALPVSVCGILYIAARLFLVVEAFISLRWAPAAAFQAPNWVFVVPHFN